MDIIEAVKNLKDGKIITREGIWNCIIELSDVANEPEVGNLAFVTPALKTDQHAIGVWVWYPSEEDIKATDWKIVENKV